MHGQKFIFIVSNPAFWLILVAALLTYGTLTAGLMGVGAFVDLNTKRILKAIELGAGDHNEFRKG
jgi:hypothetical protein